MAATRVRVFVDFWNFTLGLNQAESDRRGQDPRTFRFQIDWIKTGRWLAERAAESAQIPLADCSFDGVNVYTSHDANTEKGKAHHKWATGWLSRQAGVTVNCRERKPKSHQKCPKCHVEIDTCPHCNEAIKATQEKGVDTLIATDMIRLAWEDAYDLAVLATSDRDLIPAAEFLALKGHKVIHAAMPPRGFDLSKACWASFDVLKGVSAIERT